MAMAGLRVVPAKFYPISLFLFFFSRSLLSSFITSANRFHSFFSLSFSFSFLRTFPPPIFDFNPRTKEKIVARVLNALRTWHPRCAVWARAPLTTPLPLSLHFLPSFSPFFPFSRPCVRLFRSFFAYIPHFSTLSTAILLTIALLSDGEWTSKGLIDRR